MYTFRYQDIALTHPLKGYLDRATPSLKEPSSQVSYPPFVLQLGSGYHIERGFGDKVRLKEGKHRLDVLAVVHWDE